MPDVSRVRRHWETWFPRSVVARAGLAETLSALHAQGIRLGVVTNGEVRFQEPKITQLAIGRYLSTVVISEAVQVQKPDPRIFAHALAAACSLPHDLPPVHRDARRHRQRLTVTCGLCCAPWPCVLEM